MNLKKIQKILCKNIFTVYDFRTKEKNGNGKIALWYKQFTKQFFDTENIIFVINVEEK